MLRIAFDIGGVISKYPEIFRPLMQRLHETHEVAVHVITDMHPHDEVMAVLDLNGFGFVPASHVHCADYDKHGEGCKTALLDELQIDMFFDDFIGYVAEPSDAIRLLVMPDATKPYHADSWKTLKGEPTFGRRTFKRK